MKQALTMPQIGERFPTGCESLEPVQKSVADFPKHDQPGEDCECHKEHEEYLFDRHGSNL